MNDSASLATLADIELPAAPPEPLLLPWLLVLFAVLVAGIVWAALRVRRRLPSTGAPAPQALHRQALERIGTLRGAWERGEIRDREAGYRLGTLLRRGLAMTRLDETPAVVDDPAAWQRLVQRLDVVRYQPHPPPLTAALFDEAQAWLARAGDPPDDPGNASRETVRA